VNMNEFYANKMRSGRMTLLEAQADANENLWRTFAKRYGGTFTRTGG
jgi:uncharacterized protein (DUF1810 family)